jgi:hypothetical protein
MRGKKKKKKKNGILPQPPNSLASKGIEEMGTKTCTTMMEGKANNNRQNKCLGQGTGGGTLN